MVKRYGTSSMECPNGIYVLHAEYEKVLAECERLRGALATPIAALIQWSDIETSMLSGWSDSIAEDALRSGKKVTAYYGEVRPYTMRSKEQS